MGHLIPILRGPGRVFVTMIPTQYIQEHQVQLRTYGT
jgi:hypothetical protein